MTMPPPSSDDLTRKNARMGLIVLGVVVGMVGLSFASVPLYDMFCRVTGFGGTTQTSDVLPERVLERVVSIRFDANTARDMMWEFKPEQRSVDVRLGEKGITAYEAYNPHTSASTGTAIYNVTPLRAGQYFHKIQCFCFDAQSLQAGERVSMPILFYVDPAMDDDPNMDDVETITLSYTFFNSESEELEGALEAFYNGR